MVRHDFFHLIVCILSLVYKASRTKKHNQLSLLLDLLLCLSLQIPAWPPPTTSVPFSFSGWFRHIKGNKINQRDKWIFFFQRLVLRDVFLLKNFNTKFVFKCLYNTKSPGQMAEGLTLNPVLHKIIKYYSFSTYIYF